MRSPRRPAWLRLVNSAGATLGRFGLGSPRLEAGDLIARAERRARLSDWGDDGFREGLDVLSRAFEEQDGLTMFNRLAIRESLIQLLVNRLRIQADLTRHPEILDVPIRRPLFVTGFHRSGTTLLHRLLSTIPGARALLYWESREPSPPPRPETRRTDPRVARTRRRVDRFYRMAPQMAAIHRVDPEGPEECNPLFMHGCVAPLGLMSHLPRYEEWLATRDFVGPYGYYRRQLQLLSWLVPGDPWVLKSPAHLGTLDALLAAFPDARVVVTHRDLLQVVPSACSLIAGFRGLVSDAVDLREIGEQTIESMAKRVDRALAVRTRSGPAHFLDVCYPRLIADPVGTVKQICQTFGYPLAGESEDRLRTWLADNPRHKHGVHRYSLDQFGLDAGTVNRRLASYRDWADRNLPCGI